MRIVIDAGHGGYDAGAVANGLKEKDLNLKIALYLRDFLKNYDCDTILTRESDNVIWNKANDLQKRCDIANSAKADFFVSIHINAGGGTGYETWVADNAAQKTIGLVNVIHSEVASFYKNKGFIDRGVKKGMLYVLRHTAMPAVLLENLFIDSKKDATFLAQESNLKDIAQAICNGIAQALGLKQKSQAKSTPNTTPHTLYRVQVGAFNQKENAEKLLAELKSKGYNGFIKEEK